MNKAAFDQIVEVLDEAIELAADAVKAADAKVAPAPQESVVLVKVAADRYRSVAAALHKTGTFRDHTQSGLAKSLESSDTNGLLELLEKLASKAVFPFDAAAALGGDLVEQSDKLRANAVGEESRTDLWARCCEEVGLGS